jgi:tRNA U54 and U55 pseudouridine synthase Pus10
MGTQQSYLDRKERILAAKELAAIREVGKCLQQLFFFKGNIFTWVNSVQLQQNSEEAGYVRDLFSQVATQLEEVWQALQETQISNLALGAEVSQKLAEAKSTYAKLAALSDAEIFGDRGLIDIIEAMEALQESGSLILSRVDEHRTRLDCTY